MKPAMSLEGVTMLICAAGTVGTIALILYVLVRAFLDAL